MKLPPPPNYHATLGRFITEAIGSVVDTELQIRGHYPKTHTFSKQIAKIDGMLRNLRCDLDNQMFREFPDTPLASPYYPGRKPK